LKVVVTTPQIAEAVEKIAGSGVAVRTLVAPGIDPHTYKATPSDVTALKQADLILYSGLHLEAQMEKVFQTQRKRSMVAAVSEDIPREKLLPDPELKGHFDPHFWHDITLWKQAVATTRDRLIDVDKANSRRYILNASVYLKALDRLQADVEKELERVPPSARILVTIHDAFSYFAKRHGFRVENIQGVNTESAASVSDVKRVTDFLINNKIPALFLENSTPTRSAEAIIEGSKAKGWRVTLAGTLYADGPGEKGSPAGTYEGMMRANVNTITSALAPRQN
jgi:manganese/zinc/iron transport system substrate-binding protein